MHNKNIVPYGHLKPQGTILTYIITVAIRHLRDVVCYILSLTSRENEVLELLTEGINYKSIAGKLIISETTVKTHVNNIFQKLQVNDRTNAVLYALSHGFKTTKSAAMTTV